MTVFEIRAAPRVQALEEGSDDLRELGMGGGRYLGRGWWSQSHAGLVSGGQARGVGVPSQRPGNRLGCQVEEEQQTDSEGSTLADGQASARNGYKCPHRN